MDRGTDDEGNLKNCAGIATRRSMSILSRALSRMRGIPVSATLVLWAMKTGVNFALGIGVTARG